MTPFAGDRQERRVIFVALTVSALAHLLVGAMMQVPWGRSKPPPRAIEVELAPLGVKQKQAPVPVPEAPAPKEPEPKQPEPKPATPPKAEPAPPPTPSQAKPAPAATPEPAAEPAPAAAEKPAAESETKQASGGSLSDIRELLEKKRAAAGDGETDDGYGLPSGVQGRLYFREVVAAIQGVWRIPPGTQKRPIEIRVRIAANGTLLSHSVSESSGDRLLDRSAVAAIKRASLPAPPAEFKTPLSLTLRLIPPEE